MRIAETKKEFQSRRVWRVLEPLITRWELKIMEKK
jgi:hypothetical protein